MCPPRIRTPSSKRKHYLAIDLAVRAARGAVAGWRTAEATTKAELLRGFMSAASCGSLRPAAP
jgi:hypothetical protein